jgi:GxxExxY protein
MLFYILFVFLASLASLAVDQLHCVYETWRSGECNVQCEPGEAYDRVAHSVIGAAIEVHRHLGPGYIEAVYGNALEVEMNARNIAFVRRKNVEVFYKGQPVGRGEVDFFVGGMLVVELKTVETFAPIHIAQVISYLKALGEPLGLLINFKVPMVKDGVKRVAYSVDARSKSEQFPGS